jgi:hypothetical protein
MRTNQQNSTKSTATLTQQQWEMIAALVRGATVTDATKQANVDRTTFYLWLKSDATFVAELNRAKQEQTDAIRAQLRGLADTAMATLREMLIGAEISPGVRLKAALSVLQSLGSLEPEPIGKTEPDQVETQQFLDSF